MKRTNEPLIIRRKSNRKQKAAASSGAWKVAFADFTLAMMALFMVLWIIQMSDNSEKEEIASTLRGDLFDVGSINPFDLSWAPSLVDMQGDIAIQQSVLPAHATGTEKRGPALHNFIPAGEDNPNAGKGKDLNAMIPGKFETQAQLELLAKEINEVIEDTNVESHVKLILVAQGIRILIHDDDNKDMFAKGSYKMSPYFEDLLMALGPSLSKVKNKMSISGHTDKQVYASKKFTNWELSSLRALTARRVLEYAGVERHQVIQVTGMADQLPMNREKSLAPENRRIELLILSDEAEKQITAMNHLPESEYRSEVSEASKVAKSNQYKSRYPEQWTNN
ncbi:hypothetical protein SOPP22_17980 [Shewanella sp. OPT22]|nr:hypothetical protein SOPP22_17980 [Shewanella sp. OPT22]